MKRQILLTAIILTLTAACVPTYQPTQQIDRFTLQSEANRMLDQANGIATATAQAAIAEANEAIAQQAQTQSSFSNMATGTAQSMYAQATGTSLAMQAQATGTAVIVEASQTALALAVAQQQATATAASAESQATQEAAMMALALEQEQARLDREIVVRNTLWIAGIVLIASLTVGAGYVAYHRQQAITRGRVKRDSVIDGIVLSDKDDTITLALPAKSFGSVIALDGKDTISPEQIHWMLQKDVTAQAQFIEIVQEYHKRTQTQKALPQMSQAPTLISHDEQLPARAEWSQFADHQGNSIPLGLLAGGELLTANIDDYPHRLFAGATGSGKSRGGLRPFISGALVRGWQVVSVSDIPVPDLKVFSEHENFYRIMLNDPTAVIPLLLSVHAEIKNRLQTLDQAGTSTWSRLNSARARQLIVFDEFSAFADALESKEKKEFFKQTTQIARLGRKVGISLAAGVQNPTRENIRPSIKRNMTPVAFRVLDDVASRVIIDASGASELEQGQFIARMDSHKRGVAFAPDDSDIKHYIDGVSYPVYAPPHWVSSAEAHQSATRQDDQSIKDASQAEQIRQLHEQGLSKRQIQIELFGYDGGKAAKEVNMALRPDGI